MNAAPKLVPIIGHRYLLAEPCKAGNPILSIYQSDIIIYGVTLHNYFLTEFEDLTGVEHPYGTQITQENSKRIRQFPSGEIFYHKIANLP